MSSWKSSQRQANRTCDQHVVCDASQLDNVSSVYDMLTSSFVPRAGSGEICPPVEWPYAKKKAHLPLSVSIYTCDRLDHDMRLASVGAPMPRIRSYPPPWRSSNIPYPILLQTPTQGRNKLCTVELCVPTLPHSAACSSSLRHMLSTGAFPSLESPIFSFCTIKNEGGGHRPSIARTTMFPSSSRRRPRGWP